MDWLTEGLNDLNYWLVLLASIVSMAVGYYWYGDKLFGRIWRKEHGLTKAEIQNKEGMASMMLQSFILTLITQSVLQAILLASGTTTVSDSIALAIVIGFAFSLVVFADNYLYQRKSMTLTAVDGGFRIVALVIGAIVVATLG